MAGRLGLWSFRLGEVLQNEATPQCIQKLCTRPSRLSCGPCSRVRPESLPLVSHLRTTPRAGPCSLSVRAVDVILASADDTSAEELIPTLFDDSIHLFCGANTVIHSSPPCLSACWGRQFLSRLSVFASRCLSTRSGGRNSIVSLLIIAFFFDSEY